jgi:hypothetical protein
MSVDIDSSKWVVFQLYTTEQQEQSFSEINNGLQSPNHKT